MSKQLQNASSRFSQAQLLIAALIAVVFTGDRPSLQIAPKPLEEEIVPLVEEFDDIFSDKRQVRKRLAVASILHISDDPYQSQQKNTLNMQICETRLMPSTVARKITEIPCPFSRSAQSIPAIAVHLRKLRIEVLGCDQEAFARLLGVSQAIVSQWESGRYTPSAIAMKSIGKLDGADESYWFDMADQRSIKWINRPVNSGSGSSKQRSAWKRTISSMGINPIFALRCLENPEELDAAWHRCRSELQAIRAERGAKR